MGDSTEYRNALEMGTTLSEYQLKSVLGVGGFGMTYLAWDANLEKHVAIKEYLPGDLALRALDGSVVPVSTDHQYDYQWGLERFIIEARTLARFSHPHIVRVNRYFEANGTGYMVMDYEEGESLSQWLKRAPLPPETELRRILLPLLDGLAAVHAAQFLHRDIKPSNIFMRANGTPVLLDFGAARATGGGTRSLTAVLTPGYAPLEQYATDGKQGPWSDIYAMGGVLYRAVTDRNPPDAVSRLQDDAVKAGLAAAQDAWLAEALPGAFTEKLLRAVKHVSLHVSARDGRADHEFPRLAGSFLTPAELGTPALAFVRAVCHLYSLDPAEAEAVTVLRRQLLKMIHIKEFGSEAAWRDPCKSLVLPDVVCPSCQDCLDIDLCRDPRVQARDWRCGGCGAERDVGALEARLALALRRVAEAYLVQDLKCVKCGTAATEHLQKQCDVCGGHLKASAAAADVSHQVAVFGSVAAFQEMETLQELADWLVQTRGRR